jgi:hypothetical protein
MLWLSPEFFKSMGIRIISGRDFRWYGDHSTVVMVNDVVVRRFFDGQAAVGRTLRIGSGDAGVPRIIVGIVSDVRYNSMRETPRPMAYLPVLQAPSALEIATVAVKTTIHPESMKSRCHCRQR